MLLLIPKVKEVTYKLVYKKYITKNGRVYGPYFYESKRVNGRVISQYHGIEKSNFGKNNKIIPLIIASILVLGIIGFIIFNEKKISGNIISEIKGDLINGELQNGKLNLKIIEGEMIPADSVLIFENNGLIEEHILRDFLEGDETENGSFSIKDFSISGSGEGYGLIGKKEIFPNINFELKVYEEEGENEETLENNTEENETIEENITTENEEIIPEENTQNEEVSPEENTQSEETNVTEDFGAQVTSNLIKNIALSVSGFVTGFIVGDGLDYKIVSGKVSKENPFTTIGKNWEIVEGSVKIDDEEVSKDLLEIKENEGTIIVETNYTIVEEGFGEEYFGEKTKTITIDLDKLNKTLVEGELNIILSFEGNEINILSEEINEEISDEEEIIENMTEIFNETNVTIPEILNFTLKLTESEKSKILFYLNESSITTEAKSYRDKILIQMTIGEYTAEYSYSEDLTKEELDYYLERDRYLFLKDILKSLDEKKHSKENIVNMSKEFLI